MGSLAQVQREVKHEDLCSSRCLKRGDVEGLVLALLLKCRGIKAPPAFIPAYSRRSSGVRFSGI